MQTIHDPKALRRALKALRAEGRSVALVPTMGALHAGHIALVEEARRKADRVVASIFVNPTQFNEAADLAAYPRREKADARMLEEAGCALLWMPSAEAMYPRGFATTVRVAGMSEPFEGAARPGHFDGVATVVAKLFGQVRPDIALFGEKDWQQLAVVRRMARDLDLGVEIVGVPTQRDEDGLALSSRNARLSDDQRVAARALPRALGEAVRAIEAGENARAALRKARAALVKAGFEVDYVALADAATLAPLAVPDRPGRILAAARLGATRLIDNLAVGAVAPC